MNCHNLRFLYHVFFTTKFHQANEAITGGYREAKRIIESELGVPIDEIFQTFDESLPCLGPGNIFILPDNVICYLDFAMMGRISQKSREDFMDMVAGLYRPFRLFGGRGDGLLAAGFNHEAGEDVKVVSTYV
ncbi:MAG: hypothetical protein U9N19_09270 [Thermodesulfobacteriota bacterium]|nr:hypothetical protein [Thermodesulfobacteriota bacterium]